MIPFLHRTWARVDLSRLSDNARYIRGLLRPDCRMMAIVKADAYGHGAVTCARVLRDAGADCFGVSNIEEAIELRRAGLTEPILIISYTPPTEAARLAEYRITQTVTDADYARALSAAAVKAGVTLTVHIKVDTGMSRVGFVCHDLAAADAAAAQIVEAVRLPGLTAEGIFTHFATADAAPDDPFTARQFVLFTTVIKAAEKQGAHFAIRHCCNSAATLLRPEMHLDMVRPGIILYGLTPDDWMEQHMGALRPVMELKTAVSLVKELSPGDVISYGSTATVDKPTTVATVPIGYADGYGRVLSNRACMLVNGRRVPVLGRVCMDQCMLDVTGIPDVKAGTEVTVFGESDGACLPVGEISRLMGTINYETVCMVNRRVPRVYCVAGEPVSTVDYLLK